MDGMPSKIAAYLDWAPQTVRETIHRWNTKGLGGLWSGSGRGGKTKWQEADIAYLEQWRFAGALRVAQSPTEGNHTVGAGLTAHL